MSDDLRTRIAAVIRREVPCHPPAADRITREVIRELGLRQEFGALDDTDSGALYDSRDEIRPLFRGETIKRRYVTDWEPDG